VALGHVIFLWNSTKDSTKGGCLEIYMDIEREGEKTRHPNAMSDG
jgi:hypothetical protein